MAGRVVEISSRLFSLNHSYLRKILKQRSIVLNYARPNSFFSYLSKQSKHGNNYQYEVTEDLDEWKYVERLMPMVTVPKPKTKERYPSGWRPMKEESLQLPYFIERTKNYMLPIYLKLFNRGQTKITVVAKIHGDLWRLHNELKEYIETSKEKKISSQVYEGNNCIRFKGDHVYEAEQWALKKGF